MRKEDRRIATKLDLAVCVLLACLMLVVYMLLRLLLPKTDVLFTALASILLYVALLSGWIVFRLRRVGITEGIMLPTSFDEMIRITEKMAHAVLVCDENGRAVFCNNAFLSLSGLETIAGGTPLSEICEINEAEDGGAAARFDERVAVVQRIPLSREGHLYTLLSFYEETAQRKAESKYAEERTVVAYAIIDNLEEILQFVQEDYARTSSEVEERLRNWIASIGGLFRAYDRNKYLMLFDNVHLEECLDNRFEILDEIRSIRVGDGMPITVSMGVSRLPDTSLAERERAAQFALDLALQRGGDQVVFRDESGVAFFGGKTKTGFRRVNIKARVVARELLSLIGRADNVLIMGHRHGDFDSFAATIGLSRLVLNQGVRANIVVNRDDENLESCFEKIAGLSEYRGLFVDGSMGLELAGPGTLLIVADVNNPGYVECPELMERAFTIAVIDHHIKTVALNSAVKLEYIDPSASSASELISEIIEQSAGARILRPEEAELLLSGVLLDTKRFTRNTGTRTFAVAQFLRGAGANPGESFEFFKTTPEDLEKEARFNSHITIYRKHVAIAACDGQDLDPSYRIAAAKVADALLGVKGITTSFALAKIDDTVYISARSDGQVNVQMILEKFHGGGHFDVAGAQIEGGMVGAVVEQLRESIDEYFEMEEKGE